MNGPGIVRLQRRRDELPPDALLVERRPKRKLELQDDESTSRLKYIRKQDSADKSGRAEAGTTRERCSSVPSAFGTPRRVFHLKQTIGVRTGARATSARFPAQSGHVVATVVEQRQEASRAVIPDRDAAVANTGNKVASPLKRAGRGTASRTNDAMQLFDAPHASVVHSQLAAERKKFELLAQETHAHALEAIAKTPRPEVKSKPRLSGARAKALHEARNLQMSEAGSSDHGDAMDITVDSDHVFDTYILAAVDSDETMDDAPSPHTNHVNIGYLVINEDDEKLWEELIEQEEEVDLEDDDEEDENAEDHYGADYPSDELASEDEFDRGAYGYRQHAGSDDEQYDKAIWSDEDNAEALGDDLAVKGMPAQFAKYLAFKHRDLAIPADDED